MVARRGRSTVWSLWGKPHAINAGDAMHVTSSLALLRLSELGHPAEVVVRAALVQTQTADAMRGRVSAVHSLFTGTSNQLGAFESGLTAALFGTVPSVLIGGIGTIAVAALWMVLFPQLRRLRAFEEEQ